jgi:alkylated DNA nucleotide flippase Atl1
VEQYLKEKDKDVEKAVKDMGDENYIPWSERVREEGRAEIREQLAEKDEKIAEQDEMLAEKDKRIRELESQLEKLKKADA